MAFMFAFTGTLGEGVRLDHTGQHDYLKVPLEGGRSATVRLGPTGLRLTVYVSPQTTERTERMYVIEASGAQTTWVEDLHELGKGHWLHTFDLTELTAWAREQAEGTLRAVEAGRVLTDRMREAL